jgi:hypothetical protein
LFVHREFYQSEKLSWNKHSSIFAAATIISFKQFFFIVIVAAENMIHCLFVESFISLKNASGTHTLAYLQQQQKLLYKTLFSLLLLLQQICYILCSWSLKNSPGTNIVTYLQQQHLLVVYNSNFIVLVAAANIIHCLFLESEKLSWNKHCSVFAPKTIICCIQLFFSLLLANMLHCLFVESFINLNSPGTNTLAYLPQQK